MIKSPDLSIIIVSFNTKILLKECLKSVISSQRPVIRKGLPITDHQLQSNKLRLSLLTEVIVVDNASKDDSAAMVNEFAKEHSYQFVSPPRKTSKEKSGRGGPIRVNSRKPTITLIENRTNIGFAQANNQGIKKARGKYLLLLNSDTRVKPASLEQLIQFARKHPEAGIVGAKLVNPDGSVQPSVYHFPTLWRAIREYWLGQKGVYEKYAPQGEKPVEVEAVTGAAMLISRKTIEKIGLLDEKYFMYFEDLDYCRRVRLVGLKVFYLPTAEILHHHGQSAAQAGSKAYQYLIQSSKIYNGLIKYYFLFLILWIGQKWQSILGRK